MEKSSLAGNLIDEAMVGHMKRNPIDVYWKMKQREEGKQRDILHPSRG